MVDVSGKPATRREAVAEGFIRMAPAALAAIREGAAAKGDVLAVARVAGIMAAKRTADLLPLCHPLPLSGLALDLGLEEQGIRATARVRTTDRTGVEMEALAAVSVALLAIYDMVKALDRGMVIEGVRLLSKTGGRSGGWQAPEASPQSRSPDVRPPTA